jgi:hypothetical protein
LVISGSIGNVNYIDFNTGSAAPAWKSGRVFWDNTDGALSVYNAEADITLQVGQENWTRVRNNTGTTITNGTVVRLDGAQGDVPTVVRAQSLAVSGSVNLLNQILGVATHDIEDNSFGYITTQGLVRGLNTNAFNDGDTLFVGTGSSGVLQNTAPRAPFEIIPVGVCVKASPGGSGIIYVAVQQPYDFGDLSSVLVSGSYNYGDLWTYVKSGSLGVWTHTTQLSGSYGLTGSLTATSFTGSLLGTASFASFVPASGIIGNLSQIATASFTASVSPTQFTVTSASITEFTVTGTGVTIGNAITDTHRVTGSLAITGSTNITGPLTATQIGVGAAPSGSVPLDVRAQGALSTDLAFRVRNSADNNNFITITGNGNITVGNSSVVPSASTLRVFSGFGGGNFLNLINDSTSFEVYQGLDMTHTGRPGYFALETAGNQGSSITRFRGGGSNSAGAKITAYIDHPGDTDKTGQWQFRTQVHLGDAYRTYRSTLGNHTLLIETGSAPTTSSANAFIMYAFASTAGNTRPYFRTENGTIVWLGDESRLFNVTASRTIISSSQNTVSGSSLTVYGSGSAQPVFTVQGSQGELFSITDSLSGSLFSVNDISGLPILEVFSDNTTLIGDYQDPMLITTKKVTMTNSGSFVVYSLPTASYDTAFYDYSIRSGSNARAGQIMAIQSGSSVNFTETTTTDFGNTTAVSFTVIVSGSNMVLTGSATTGSWTTKCIIRGL